MALTGDFGFGKCSRLLLKSDYSRVLDQGERIVGPFFVVLGLPREEDDCQARLGIIASKKVGKAVRRNKVKRRIREIFRAWQGRAANGSNLDFVVIARARAVRASYSELEQSLEDCMIKLQSRYLRKAAN